MTPRTLRARVDAVVVGASAGGVEALGVLLPALPRGLRIPGFVVIHLPKDRKSLLSDIFTTRCSVPVREAQDKDAVIAGTVYFAPPDYHMLIDDGPQIALSADPEVHYSRPSIDVLFQSAAEIYGPRLAAILATGANQDGTAGLLAVRDAGGVVIVQDPVEAQSPMMVASALQSVGDAWVLPLAGIAGLLATLDQEATA